MVLGMNASAADSDAKGLIGIGVGYTGTEYNKPGTNGAETDMNGGPALYLKFGAESDYYRVFVDSSYWYTDEYHSAGTIGGAIQYLIHPTTDAFNIFLGLNAGWINTINDTDVNPYYGLDAGVNLNINKDFGIEIGGRTSWTNDNKSDYVSTVFFQGYVNAIFKFTGIY